MYMGVVLREHPVRGESHIQRNANRLVATYACWEFLYLRLIFCNFKSNACSPHVICWSASCIIFDIYNSKLKVAAHKHNMIETKLGKRSAVLSSNWNYLAKNSKPWRFHSQKSLHYPLSFLLFFLTFQAVPWTSFSRWNWPETLLAPFPGFLNPTTLSRKDQVLQIWLCLEK